MSSPIDRRAFVRRACFGASLLVATPLAFADAALGGSASILRRRRRPLKVCVMTPVSV